jgi:tetratricopeptide (TPR) repeat protein
MKSNFWKTAISYGLAFCLGSNLSGAEVNPEVDDTDTLLAQAGRGGQKGGGGGQRGGGGHRGGGRPGSGSNSGRGNAGDGFSGRGAIHAPSMNGPRLGGVRPGNGRGGSVSGANHSPSFSRPSVRTGSGNAIRNSIAGRQHRGPVLSPGAGAARSAPSFNGRSIGLNRLPRVNNVGRQINNARIGNRPFQGNSINFNNRAFNVGSSHYQPSHYRHSGYHGYWNGNRGASTRNNVLSAVAYGLGSGLGNGNYGFGNYGYGNYGGYNSYNGYGNGWGWGLGNGYRGGRGYRSYSGYGYRPLGWGLGGWGLGSLIYNSGYLGYSNPYYVNSGTAVYNYTQPIPVSYNTEVAVNETDSTSADTVLNEAVEAFRQKDYDQSLDITNKGIAQYSDDAVLHEFRSLVLFAKQDFQQSAATIHSVLAVGPGWDWTTMSGMYSNAELYTAQLRALESFTKSNPQDAASQFLLAYHYMTCGHPDAAARQLQTVVALMPNDRVAVDLLRMLAPPKAESAADPLTTASSTRPADQPDEVAPKPIDPKTLVGKWASSRADGSEFKLDLTNDAKFTWSFTPKDQAAQEFGGTYKVEDNVIVLERKDGGSLIAEVSPVDAGKFNFRLFGAAEDDKGLDFSK